MASGKDSKYFCDENEKHLSCISVKEYATNSSKLSASKFMNRDINLGYGIDAWFEWTQTKAMHSIEPKLNLVSRSIARTNEIEGRSHQEPALSRDTNMFPSIPYLSESPLVELSSSTTTDNASYPLTPRNKIDGIKFWAVVTGVDEYKASPLRGCVADAKMVFEYLRNYLCVPESHIQLLLSAPSADIKESTESRNKQPTRTNIVNAILGLSINLKIQHGDNIIIYFAGHGTRYECVDYSLYGDGTPATLGTIEALCPMDRASPRSTDSANAPGTDVNNANSSVTSDRPLPDISDREINTILAEIARNKGDHITFILDCCHSASITRGLMEAKGVRYIDPLEASSSIQDMFSAADEALNHIDGYQSISMGTWRANMDSHVILAACKSTELAKEVKGTEGDGGLHGVFTQALIDTLKSADLNDKSMTYYNLLAALPNNVTQHPVIAGKHKRWRLWFQDDNNNINASST
ncbi:caspase domain-containing protein [Armillaria luteobubalina]|uniref:Caspase domain-containing protein n=1 Tax=Armillaria luteobubalina TaxID=153913 RepID=A0AA39PJU2_9AGAR|nr:caspase domain-containing protein [Armillaria luteobubalina]